jgi:hypothetical protein
VQADHARLDVSAMHALLFTTPYGGGGVPFEFRMSSFIAK